MNIDQMTRRDFESLPGRGWDEDIDFDSMVILPAHIPRLSVWKYKIRLWLSKKASWVKEPQEYEIDGMHDSGFRYMDFVAVRENKAICRLAGGSDVIHIDGIGGYGRDWIERYGTVPRMVPVSGWSIDCLPKSGLLRIWPGSHQMTCGPALSSFEIYAL